jgi:hypothetical protein
MAPTQFAHDRKPDLRPSRPPVQQYDGNTVPTSTGKVAKSNTACIEEALVDPRWENGTWSRVRPWVYSRKTAHPSSEVVVANLEYSTTNIRCNNRLRQRG